MSFEYLLKKKPLFFKDRVAGKDRGAGQDKEAGQYEIKDRLLGQV